jgi:regulator of replication initiation timing
MTISEQIRELEDRIDALEKQLGELTQKLAWLLEMS